MGTSRWRTVAAFTPGSGGGGASGFLHAASAARAIGSRIQAVLRVRRILGLAWGKREGGILDVDAMRGRRARLLDLGRSAPSSEKRRKSTGRPSATPPPGAP